GVLDRLLEPEDVVRLDHPAEADRLVGPPGVVAVDHQLEARADRLPDRPHALGVVPKRRAAPANLHLDRPVAHLEVPLGLGHEPGQLLALAVEAAARVDLDPAAVAAEQLPDRLAEDLAGQVPERDVDPAEREPEVAPERGVAR